MAASSSLLLLLLLFISTACRSQNTSTSTSTDPTYYYTLCSNSTCGNQSIPYPFALPPLCHNPLVTPSCAADGIFRLSSQSQTGSFRVIGKVVTDTTGSAAVQVASDSLFGCNQISRANYTYGITYFSLPNNYTYGTHLNCTKTPTGSAAGTLQPASCLGCTDEGNVCYYFPGFINFPECEQFFLFVPVGFNVSAEKDLRGYLQKGFPLKYSNPVQCQSCEASGGRCGADPSGSFVCFCPTSVHGSNCSDGVLEDLQAWFPQNGKSKSSTTLIVALTTSLSVVVLLLVAATIVFFIHRRKSKSLKDSEMEEDNEKITQTGLEDLVQGISPTRYSYSKIKKFTNNFATKLGEGGFGHIYRGTIQKNKIDIPVAVKILKDTKQSEKQFMSEVATIGRIHHNNLVRMLGYCVQGKKRALIYEFMANGSLDKFINMNKNRDISDESNGVECLSPRQMQAIALDTARGLQYLHEGCRSRILHCDIKPHNVLLDSNFSAKVSDFGLAKMMDKDISHISLTDARGTPGYAAPEMWSKSYGPITEKSDVYSYGMLILEMLKGREDYELGMANSTQDFLHEWAFKQIKNTGPDGKRETSISTGNEGNSTHEKIVEKMCLVGLWCIQHIPSNRPSMSKVIQMLEGSVEIETPPHPVPADGNDEFFKHLSNSTVYVTANNESI